MPTLRASKLNKEVKYLKEDVRVIKNFLFAPLKDTEGEYQKSFVKKILKRAQNNGPFYKFTDKESFLRHVRSRK